MVVALAPGAREKLNNAAIKRSEGGTHPSPNMGKELRHASGRKDFDINPMVFDPVQLSYEEALQISTPAIILDVVTGLLKERKNG